MNVLILTLCILVVAAVDGAEENNIAQPFRNSVSAAANTEVQSPVGRIYFEAKEKRSTQSNAQRGITNSHTESEQVNVSSKSKRDVKTDITKKLGGIAETLSLNNNSLTNIYDKIPTIWPYSTKNVGGNNTLNPHFNPMFNAASTGASSPTSSDESITNEDPDIFNTVVELFTKGVVAVLRDVDDNVLMDSIDSLKDVIAASIKSFSKMTLPFFARKLYAYLYHRKLIGVMLVWVFVLISGGIVSGILVGIVVVFNTIPISIGSKVIHRVLASSDGSIFITIYAYILKLFDEVIGFDMAFTKIAKFYQDVLAERDY